MMDIGKTIACMETEFIFGKKAGDMREIFMMEKCKGLAKGCILQEMCMKEASLTTKKKEEVL
eukprot:CAMPEP_0202942010 /NCGR_PEP_ID=MMETSP1395-20130829/2172_1 /ASSEMBLY_ACC=CAM_ASM_000871 /TAXON_ID=5961 /ORGANISM="Blepharisma japonicum, Strain Stock R1072" /LENGTH=61 /DNA_ID=CAMNT_0049637799 /DNA_START=749 /DNA_END=934 /DNA_ORIENTATION=-